MNIVKHFLSCLLAFFTFAYIMLFYSVIESMSIILAHLFVADVVFVILIILLKMEMKEEYDE